MRSQERVWGARVWSALPWIALVGLALAVSLQEIRAFDYWWHLRTGALIAETGSVPKVDVYTYTVPGNRWIDVHWLFQLVLHGVHRLGGHAGVVVMKAGFTLALVAVLAPVGLRRERAWLSAGALGLVLLVAADRVMPRPELPTFVCLAGVLALLERFRARPDAWVYGIVAIQLVWANVHGLFALGIATCAIHTAGELLRPLLFPGESLRRERVRRLAAVTTLAAAAALCNPNGVEGALYPLRQLGMIGPEAERGAFGLLIAELAPAFGTAGSLPPFAGGLLGAMAVLSLVAMAANWRRLPASDPLLWVAFLYLALGATRNAALFAIVAAPLGVRNANEWLDARRAARPDPGARRRLARRVAPAAVAAGLALACIDVVAGSFHSRVGSTRRAGFGIFEPLYPIGAVDWIERERPPGPLCHDMADGGYLIHRLHPDYPVMVDGRLEVFGEETFTALQIGAPDAFRRVARETGCQTVLVHYNVVRFDALLRWLHLNSNWTLAYVDDVAAAFVRVPPDGRRRFGEISLDAPDLFSPLPEERGLEDRLRRQARTSFLMAMGRDEAALALWRETVARYPGLPGADMVMATLLERNGFAAAAEAILRRQLTENPRDPLRHVHAGDLRLEAGDLDAARRHYDAALALDPGLGHALVQRGILAEREGDPEEAARYYARAFVGAHPADRVAIVARARFRALAGP